MATDFTGKTAGIEVGEAVPVDLPQVAAVALATGQDEEWGGGDPAYMSHLLAHGSVVVGVAGGWDRGVLALAAQARHLPVSAPCLQGPQAPAVSSVARDG